MTVAGDVLLMRADDETISAREIEVLQLIALGATNREIGLALFLSVSTVKVHVASLLVKLDVRNRTQAAVRGVECGIVRSVHEFERVRPLAS